MLESDAVNTIGQQLRAADGARRKELMLGIRDSYSAVGRKLSAVMQLAVAWAEACEGHALSAQAPLASVLGKHLTRLLMPGGGNGSSRVIQALLNSHALQQEMPAGLTSPALTGVLASLARRFSDSESRGVLDHIITTANLWGHVPVAVPHILQRQADLADHVKATAAVTAVSLAAGPAIPPSNEAYSLPIASPELKLHLPVLTAVFSVLVAQGVHRKLLKESTGGAVLAPEMSPALVLMERLAHVLASDEAACSGAKRLGLPPLQAVVPGAYAEARQIAIGSACTPLALVQGHLLREAGQHTADWPCAANWSSTAAWVLAAQHSLDSNAQGEDISSGAGGAPEEALASSTAELKKGIVALGVCSEAQSELHAAAALTAAAAVALHKVAATALLLFPASAKPAHTSKATTKTAHAEISSVWLCRESGFQVAAAVKASPLAASVFLHGTRGCFLVPEVAQSQQWVDRVCALLHLLPVIAGWHPVLRAAVCDLVCELVSHLSHSRSAAADATETAGHTLPTGADISDSRPLGVIAVSAQRVLSAVASTFHGLGSLAAHLCLPCWNRNKEFAMVSIRNILRDNVLSLEGAVLRRILLVLAVSRGATSDSNWGLSFAQTYPHSMAALYQSAVSCTSKPSEMINRSDHHRRADGRQEGDAALWEAAGILSHGTTPWVHARQLWEALMHTISPCSAVD